MERHKVKTEVSSLMEKKEMEKKDLKEIENQFEKLKLLLGKKSYARRKQEANQTTQAMILSDNTTRYRRRKESKEILEFIHGGEFAAVYGAWDFLASNCDLVTLEKFLLNFKRGKFLQNIYDRQSKLSKSDESELKKAVAIKYMGHMSRRRYNLICKIQQSSLKDSEDIGHHLPKNDDFKLDLRTKQLSHYSVEKFVKSLDIGEIHQIEGCSGVARTVTALVTMIADVNLKVETNKDHLVWFNDIKNHFIVEFSDDGAPESKEVTMTIATLSLWNFGNRIRSRDYHYPLHMLSVEEKNQVCEDLWAQHCDEMLLIESNIFKINGQKVTFEFVPSADQSWQCWAANCLPSSATYPSPYANVHKSQLSLIGGSIGFEKDNTWTPPTKEKRKKEVEKLEKFRKTLSKDLSDETLHKTELKFMADEGCRQIGTPRIGVFADRLYPEPLHLEINNWQHVLTLIYHEAVRRSKFDQFFAVLCSPVNNKDKPGCGLKFVGKIIKEQYEIESKRMNVLEARLIGSQAISLAQHSHRLIDSLKSDDDSEAEKIKFGALALICRMLRDIGGLMNRVNVSKRYVTDLSYLCKVYFNLFALFFTDKCQSTVWTLGYAVPYHAKKLYEGYQVGYGILSMQGKESMHSSVKQQLRNETNRSISLDQTGKWHQIMRSSFVRNFYLPYHFPIESNYHAHSRSRKAAYDDGYPRCACSRILVNEIDGVCSVCDDSTLIYNSATTGILHDSLVRSLKPISCNECHERFPDHAFLERHVKECHSMNKIKASRKIIPSKMTVAELKSKLKELNKSATGSKEILIRRLEGLL